MDTTLFKVTLGDRGRLVLPAELREHLGLEKGTVLALRVGEDAVELISREALLARARAEWAKVPGDAIAELIADRRREALADLVDALEDGWRPTSDEVLRFRETFGDPWRDVEGRYDIVASDAEAAA